MEREKNMNLKKIIKKLILSYKNSSDDYINHLRNIGVSIGENVHIFCPAVTNIDTNNPHLLTIGNNVKITGPTTILTHDYSTSVLNVMDRNIYGKQKETIIGNNVFIGWGATILGGAIIGDNTIIGASAVVSGRLEPNSVYAGNPAKRILSIEDYREKIKRKQLDDAYHIYVKYLERFKNKPNINIFHEYFYIFEDKYEKLPNIFKSKLKEERITEEEFGLNKSEFNTYDNFIKYCEDRYKNEKN